MVTRFKSIFFASLLLASIPAYADNQQDWSMAPAKAVLMTFWAGAAVIGNPNIGTMMYRYAVFSPIALVTAATTTTAWNAFTNPTLRLWLKKNVSEFGFIPF